MTWEPKNGLNDEDVDVSDEEENDTSFKEEKSRTGETIFCNCARRCTVYVLFSEKYSMFLLDAFAVLLREFKILFSYQKFKFKAVEFKNTYWV